MKREQWEEEDNGNVEMVEKEMSEGLEMEMSEVLEMLTVGTEHRPAESHKRRRIRRDAPVISTLRPVSPKESTLVSTNRPTWNPVSMITRL